jgi:uncharacterized protein (DUF2141 family)
MKKLFFLFIISIFLASCARVGSPNGGKKDTLAPRFLSSNIDTSRVKVPTKLKELRLNFDEYVNLKDINKHLIISPPIKKIKKIIPSNLANKYVLIQWEDDLQENTTYNFNFGNAIVDNNEGNALPYYNFVFSTGDRLDDLYISGTITDALLPKNKSATGDKAKSIVVGLYKEEQNDFKQKPYYITKVDDDGYFELNYLSEGKYTLIAFEDENQNSVYDTGKEKVSFLKNKIDLDKSISGLKLKLYPSKKVLKYKEMKAIVGGILMQFEGNPSKVEVRSLNEELKDYKVTHHTQSDSVRIWFDAQRSNIGTSAGSSLKFSYDADSKKDTVSIFYKANPKDELSLVNNKGNLLVPGQDFSIFSNLPVQDIQTEKWVLKSDSISQAFTAKISEKNAQKIVIQSDFKAGKKYSLSIPKESVASFYQSNTKPYRFDFEADKTENYGALTLKIKSKPNTKFWIQLLDDKNEIQYSKYTDLAEIKWTNLKPATYFARILVDNNGNGIWDEADFATQTHAEDAFLFPKEIVIRQLWEMVEDWDLEEK